MDLTAEAGIEGILVRSAVLNDSSVIPAGSGDMKRDVCII